MTDLFISYNSHDEVWAKKLFLDLTTRFPTIKPFWARDTTAIPPGEPFRPIFQGAAQDASNFVIFWSTAAQRSNEVGPEIQSFLQNRQTHPMSAAGDKRTLFYIPLETAVDYGGLVDIQGFPDFRDVYNPNVSDCGIAGLGADPAGENWHRMIRSIGNTVLAGQASQPITLALMVMTTATKSLVDPFVNMRISNGPTLAEFLESMGLLLNEVKARYDDTAFTWRPFGTRKTIMDLMEDVRETAIRNLGEPYRFHWKPMDFVKAWSTVPDEAANRRLIESLSEGPSVIVTDPISLFNPVIKLAFKDLGEYAKKQQSMILSISPNELLAAESLYNSLLRNSSPVLSAYLYPEIPAAETFALCGLNVQHAWDIERLIRSGLGYYYLQKKKAASQPLVSPGV
jgi:TIR domain